MMRRWPSGRSQNAWAAGYRRIRRQVSGGGHGSGGGGGAVVADPSVVATGDVLVAGNSAGSVTIGIVVAGAGLFLVVERPSDPGDHHDGRHGGDGDTIPAHDVALDGAGARGLGLLGLALGSVGLLTFAFLGTHEAVTIPPLSFLKAAPGRPDIKGSAIVAGAAVEPRRHRGPTSPATRTPMALALPSTTEPATSASTRPSLARRRVGLVLLAIGVCRVGRMVGLADRDDVAQSDPDHRLRDRTGRRRDRERRRRCAVDGAQPALDPHRRRSLGSAALRLRRRRLRRTHSRQRPPSGCPHGGPDAAPSGAHGTWRTSAWHASCSMGHAGCCWWSWPCSACWSA